MRRARATDGVNGVGMEGGGLPWSGVVSLWPCGRVWRGATRRTWWMGHLVGVELRRESSEAGKIAALIT